jgi:methyl-accepting chemotaxis protein
MKKYKRRNYLINKSLQLRYMAMVAILVAVVSIATGWIIYSTIWTMLLDRLKNVAAIDTLIIDSTRIGLLRAFCLIVAGMCLTGLLVMFIIHRVAGPLFRVKRIMDQIAAGLIPIRLKFRKGDELQDIATAIDAAVHKIAEVSRQNLKVVEEASVIVQRTKDLLSRAEPNLPEANRELDNLAKRLQELETFHKEEDE